MNTTPAWSCLRQPGVRSWDAGVWKEKWWNGRDTPCYTWTVIRSSISTETRGPTMVRSQTRLSECLPRQCRREQGRDHSTDLSNVPGGYGVPRTRCRMESFPSIACSSDSRHLVHHCACRSLESLRFYSRRGEWRCCISI